MKAVGSKWWKALWVFVGSYKGDPDYGRFDLESMRAPGSKLCGDTCCCEKDALPSISMENRREMGQYCRSSSGAEQPMDYFEKTLNFFVVESQTI